MARAAWVRSRSGSLPRHFAAGAAGAAGATGAAGAAGAAALASSIIFAAASGVISEALTIITRSVGTSENMRLVPVWSVPSAGAVRIWPSVSRTFMPTTIFPNTA